ncbi:hypothetical protein [Arabidopsis thaliana]|uniref:Uncharacterized protein AT4g02910 n=1 Tax=Arabidopsis thaliana TaxID=3702 RepID=Q9ZT89_ARATH|nr:uncharacterized protein AT4G02910 [Arabidopsis thaliana]AAC79115.1 hypothetical protein [Arabidopsis thaliana]AAD15339.1 hypothetical protein [Arabidopsis thaliana]AEE82249.1 hypothetical protein AT4G02910 [Arabidopsis thaliana]CAB77776.1 hypothetical protein [Arabidopsis thaliana]|eukprot:NP_192200.1 hypothetical protein AT4G02910 [Arabidopsis thaliana]
MNILVFVIGDEGVCKSSLVTKFANDNDPRATYDRNPRGHKIEIDIDGRRWMFKISLVLKILLKINTHRLSLVQTPEGVGKSSLVTKFAEDNGPMAAYDMNSRKRERGMVFSWGYRGNNTRVKNFKS